MIQRFKMSIHLPNSQYYTKKHWSLSFTNSFKNVKTSNMNKEILINCVSQHRSVLTCVLKASIWTHQVDSARWILTIHIIHIKTMQQPHLQLHLCFNKGYMWITTELNSVYKTLIACAANECSTFNQEEEKNFFLIEIPQCHLCGLILG